MDGKLRETVYLISLALTEENFKVSMYGLFSEEAMEHIVKSKTTVYASSTLMRFCLKTLSLAAFPPIVDTKTSKNADENVGFPKRFSKVERFKNVSKCIKGMKRNYLVSFWLIQKHMLFKTN